MPSKYVTWASLQVFWAYKSFVTEQRAPSLSIHQANYTNELVSRYHTGKPDHIPMCPRARLTTDSLVMERPERYPQLMGVLQHLVTCTRPALAEPVSALASFTERPTNVHWEVALQVLSYVASTANTGITYGTTTSSLEGYTDPDYAGMPGSRSTSGMVFMLFGASISWQSKLQPTVAGSTCKAEYRAANSAEKEAHWLRKLMRHLASPIIRPSTIYGDNTSAIALLANHNMMSQ